MKTPAPARQQRVNVAAAPAAATHRRHCTHPDPIPGCPDRKDGADVADLLYALTATAVFAVLLLAVRGLDRL